MFVRAPKHFKTGKQKIAYTKNIYTSTTIISLQAVNLYPIFINSSSNLLVTAGNTTNVAFLPGNYINRITLTGKLCFQIIIFWLVFYSLPLLQIVLAFLLFFEL